MKKLVLLLCLFPLTSWAIDPLAYFKDLHTDIFPIPVFQSRPDEGQTYGLMPVAVMTDDKSAIKSLIAVIGQYNSIKRIDTAALAYFYPEPDQAIEFYGELAQDYARELSARYFNPTLHDHFYVEAKASYLKTPFGFFYGIGPLSSQNDASNYVAESLQTNLTGGYEFFKNIRAHLTFIFNKTDLSGAAFDDVESTISKYKNLSAVHNSTNLIWQPSLVFDNRPEREYSKKGSYVRLAYLTSLKDLGSNDTFQGVNVEAVHLFPLIKDRATTVLRFNTVQLYGETIPFYQQASLGGPNEFRSFIPQRFVDKGKMIFQVEERVKLFKATIFGNSFEAYVDPFFELGTVYSSLNTFSTKHWQPTGGIGLRMFVPPNVVGRLDIAVGSDGLEMYTALGYPF